MQCEHVRLQLPEYVLGLLAPEASQRVASHLAECPRCASEHRAYMETTAALALAAPPVTPRPQVKEALMARLSQQATSPTSRIRSWFVRLLAPSPRWALAGLALVTLLLFFSNLTLWSRLQRLERAQKTAPFQVVVLQGTERLPQAEGVLLFEPSNHYAVLVVRNLPPPEAGRAYQLWLIRPDGQRVSGAVFSVAPSSPWVTVIVESPEPLDRFPAFGITLEPSGGSPRPTGPKVMGGSADF